MDPNSRVCLQIISLGVLAFVIFVTLAERGAFD